MQANLDDQGCFPTANASKYLKQLCKHFGHKVEVTFDERQGQVALAPGPVTLEARDSELLVTVSALDAEGLATARRVIDSHLERFAFREGFSSMTWSRSG